MLDMFWDSEYSVVVFSPFLKPRLTMIPITMTFGEDQGMVDISRDNRKEQMTVEIIDQSR
jgi:hypothetical protein